VPKSNDCDSRAAPMLAITRQGLGSVDHEDEHFLSLNS